MRRPAGRASVGSGGETVVRAYLQGLGWRILATNYRCAQGEMDLIAVEPTLPEPVLVFVEVKTRRGTAHGSPIEAVDRRKQKKLVAIAQTFLAERNAGGAEPACRFDVAEVFVGPDGLARVTLQRAAFGSGA